MSQKIRTIIAEDELPIREEILEIALEREELQIVGIGKNGKELEELLDQKKPDLALLDIELPIKDTMTVLSEKTDIPQLIFISAFEIYAPRAFEMEAVDYLVKPIKKERFMDAISRAIRRIKAKKLNNYKTNVNPAILWIREKDKVIPIPFLDIYYLEAQDKVTLIYMNGNNYFTVTRSLSSIMQQLPPAQFLQIHRKYAVNVSIILNMEPMFHGRYELTLKGIKQKLPVSRRYATTFLKAIKK